MKEQTLRSTEGLWIPEFEYYVFPANSSYFRRTSRISSHIRALGEPGSRVGFRSKYEGWKIGMIQRRSNWVHFPRRLVMPVFWRTDWDATLPVSRITCGSIKRINSKTKGR